MDTQEIETTGLAAMAPTAERRPKARRRKVEKIKPPTKEERSTLLRTRLCGLTEELIANGFGAILKPPPPIKLIELEPDIDPKKGAFIGKVKEPLAYYLQRVSVVDNLSQRPPFDHLNDSIYRRLIRDFIEGAVIPESKVAALLRSTNGKAETLANGDIRYSIVDGLQRLYCMCIAILLVYLREKSVEQGLVPEEIWRVHFADVVAKKGDAKTATEELLSRAIRYEVFYNIDLGGLLHYMVTFNTGQRRMSLPIQLEIMRRPLIEEIERRAEVKLWLDTDKLPGQTKPAQDFSAAQLVLATEAFVTGNCQIAAGTEADRYLESQADLDEVGDIEDTVTTLKRIMAEFHPAIMRIYAQEVGSRYILSNSITFLIGFVAACGYVRNNNNPKVLDGVLDKLADLMKRPVDDPLNLREYQAVVLQIKTSRGKAMRRLADDTFRRFFLGATRSLDWVDTFKSIGGL
ncbi:MAG: hypothetical protein Q7S58_21790 [Candidatus Binatus sp.]|uniref:hypothetical protein n=1 Tax=Candidatus Binatus sp. TaxID=2811406 RepID=UPI0027159DE1|nr:hypothetical protein [Candidatus Binatus sp.]MDO8435036.1 hypothetical protein [Candidatus Binatus sp.]